MLPTARAKQCYEEEKKFYVFLLIYLSIEMSKEGEDRKERKRESGEKRRERERRERRRRRGKERGTPAALLQLCSS